MEILVGIDLSLNSTGLYVGYEMDGMKIHDYYIISKGRTKKSKNIIDSKIPYIVSMNDQVVSLTMMDQECSIPEKTGCKRIYPDNENDKTNRVMNISYIIINIIESILSKLYIIEEKKLYIGIEGVAFGSSSTNALCELAALNFTTRIFLERNLKTKDEYGPLDEMEVFIIPPSENKKFASGIGNADKDEMMFCWSKTSAGRDLMKDEMLKEAKIKLDDICDAYWLALCSKKKKGEI